MGNMCGKQTATNLSVASLQIAQVDMDREDVMEQIKQQLKSNPNTDLIQLKVKKQAFKALIEPPPSNSLKGASNIPKSQTSSYLVEAIDLIQSMNGKEFIPINFINDPVQDGLYLKVLLGNYDRIRRYDTQLHTREERKSIIESLKIQTQTVSIDNPKVLKDQIQSIVRGFYEDHSLLVIGCIQETRNLSNLNFFLANPQKCNKHYQKIDSDYFINVEKIKSLNDLHQEMAEQDADSFLQAIITIKDSRGNDNTFVIQKDIEFRKLEEDPGILAVQIIKQEDLLTTFSKTKSFVMNVHETQLNTYLIHYGGELSDRESRKSIKKTQNEEFLVQMNQEAIQKQHSQAQEEIHHKIEEDLQQKEIIEQEVVIPEVQNIEQIQIEEQVLQKAPSQVEEVIIEQKIEVANPVINEQPPVEEEKVDLGISAFSVITQNDLISSEIAPIQESISEEFEQIEQEFIKSASIVIEDLTYEQEQINPDNYLHQIWTIGKEFATNPDKASAGEPILTQIDSYDKIIQSAVQLFTHADARYQSEDQTMIQIDAEPMNANQLTQYLKLNLEFLGVDGIWKVYKIQDGPLLYASLSKRVVPNCLYETHFYKMNFPDQKQFLQEFALCNNSGELISFAVIVDRPLMDISQLWDNQNLSVKNENFSEVKSKYILLQILEELEKLKSKGINHNLLLPTSFLYQIGNCTCTLFKYTFASMDSSCKGEIQDIQDQRSNVLRLLCEKWKISNDIQQLCLSNSQQAIKALKEQCTKEIKALFIQFKQEEKQDEAFKHAAEILHLDKAKFKFELLLVSKNDEEADFSHLKQPLSYSQKLCLCEAIANKYPMNALIRGLNQNYDSCMLFSILQSLYFQGDIEVALDLYEQFKTQDQARPSMFCDLMSLMMSDFSKDIQPQSQLLNSQDCPLREQTLLTILFMKSIAHDKIVECQQIFEDLDNEKNPLFRVLLSLKFNKKLNLEEVIQTTPYAIPKYFIHRLQISCKSLTEEASQSALLKFKALKSIISLMVFHNSITTIPQYQSKDYNNQIFAFHRFAVDIFSDVSEVKIEFKQLFAELLKEMTNFATVKEIVSCFGTTQSQNQLEQQNFTSSLQVLNFIINDLVSECTKEEEKEGQYTMLYQNQFEKQMYLNFVSQALADKGDFCMYLAYILGLKEDHEGNLIQLQTKFIN